MKKIISIIIILSFMCQDTAFCYFSNRRCTLRVPLHYNVPHEGIDNTREKSLALGIESIVDKLVEHFSSITLDEQDLELIYYMYQTRYDLSRFRETDGEKEAAFRLFLGNPEFRKECLSHIKTKLPERIKDIWDESDRLSLGMEEHDRIRSGLVKRLEEKEVKIRLPQEGMHCTSSLPTDFITDNIKFYKICIPIDARLKGLIRKKLPKDLQDNTESLIRERHLGEQGAAFFRLFIEAKDCTTDIFGEALLFLLCQPRLTKTPDFEGILSINHKRIRDHYKERRGHALPFEFILSSGGFRANEADLASVTRNNQLIFYILGIDEDSVSQLFKDKDFEIGRKLARRTKRIRSISDYVNMYFEVYPVNEHAQEVSEMSLVIMNKLYMFLNEFMKLILELRQTLGNEDENDVRIFDEKFYYDYILSIQLTRKKIIDAYKKAMEMHNALRHGESIKIARELFSVLFIMMHTEDDYSGDIYPTLNNRAFASFMYSRSGEKKIQEILDRLNEIDFDSLTLLAFIVPVVEEAPSDSILKYLYKHNFKDILGFDGGMENHREIKPMDSFKDAYKEIEDIDITGISRTYPDSPMEMEIVFLGQTIDLLLFELFKNFIAYSRIDPKGKRIGNIVESFSRKEDRYYYSIEDNNDGIEPDRLRGIFNVYYTTGVDFKEFAGLGLGLPKIRNIVDMYRGRITVISRVKGQQAHAIYYKDGGFSNIRALEDSDSENPFKDTTGTRFIIEFPFPVIDMKEVIPSENERGINGELPLSRDGNDLPNRANRNSI